MKQFLLATTLIVVPTLLFSAGYMALKPNTNNAVQLAADPLGDLSSYQLIVDDLSSNVQGADWQTAKDNAKTLEAQWDDEQPTLQPMDGPAWGNVDTAIDAVLKDVRAPSPDQAQTTTDLDALTVVLNNPNGGTSGGGGVQQVNGVDVTDANGHALPCESLLKELTAKEQSANLAADVQAKVDELQSKATERCNADDDTRSDAFSAEAISLIQASH